MLSIAYKRDLNPESSSEFMMKGAFKAFRESRNYRFRKMIEQWAHLTSKKIYMHAHIDAQDPTYQTGICPSKIYQEHQEM